MNARTYGGVVRVINQYLMRSALSYPSAAAIICNGQLLTYEEMMQRIVVLGARLVEVGVKKGDRVMVALQNKRDYLVACFAAMWSGAIVVPLPEGLAPASMRKVEEHCAPSLLVTTLQEVELSKFLYVRLRTRILLQNRSPQEVPWEYREKGVLGFEPDSTLGSFQLRSPREIHEDDGALIMYTSGTSGKRKGVLLTHRNLVQATLNINEAMKLPAGVTEYVSVPLTHSFGFGRARCVLFTGGTLVLNNGFLNPAALVSSITQHECNAISWVPSGFAMFLGRLESLLARIEPLIKMMELGSSPMSLALKRKIIEIFPHAAIHMHYGLTEASRSTFLEFHSERHHLDTVGRPSPNVEVTILDEHGTEAERGIIGEVAVKGDHVARCYWGDPKLNRQRYQNGWLLTGDQGFLDEEGYLHLLGRKDDLINMGGVKISPLEIEEQIREVYHDCDICVVGMPDPGGIVDEIPVLCYVSNRGKTISPSDLSRALSAKLDRNKIPRMTYRMNALPRTNNKLMRGELRKMLAHEFTTTHRQVTARHNEDLTVR